MVSSSGWHIFSTCLLHQYHYVADRMNWTEAQTYCREKYTDLATIENTEEMNQLINTVSSSGYNSAVWIGPYSKINWRWSDGYNRSGAEYWDWKIGHPLSYLLTITSVLWLQNVTQLVDCRSGEATHAIKLITKSGFAGRVANSNNRIHIEGLDSMIHHRMFSSLLWFLFFCGSKTLLGE